MVQVFELVDPGITKETFLKVFLASGCYFIDLCPQPVDRMPPALRRAARQAGEESLARTIKRLHPQAIVTTLRSIECNVSRAITQANWSGSTIRVPYPGRWAHLKVEFVESLTPVVALLLRKTEPR